MAVTEKQGKTGSWYSSTSGNFFKSPVEAGGSYTGSLLDFKVTDPNVAGKTWSGTYNPALSNGQSDATQTQIYKDILGQQGNFSLNSAQQAVSRNDTSNPFFGEFFNYYLGLAQERQATLQKSLSRKDLLTGGDAASMLGGTLI